MYHIENWETAGIQTQTGPPGLYGHGDIRFYWVVFYCLSAFIFIHVHGRVGFCRFAVFHDDFAVYDRFRRLRLG